MLGLGNGDKYNFDQKKRTLWEVFFSLETRLGKLKRVLWLISLKHITLLNFDS